MEDFAGTQRFFPISSRPINSTLCKSDEAETRATHPAFHCGCLRACPRLPKGSFHLKNGSGDSLGPFPVLLTPPTSRSDANPADSASSALPIN